MVKNMLSNQNYRKPKQEHREIEKQVVKIIANFFKKILKFGSFFLPLIPSKLTSSFQEMSAQTRGGR